MKTSLLILAVVAVLASGAAASSSGPSSAKPSGTLYGHVKSISHVHGRLELKFDPAWWLTGVAAERACGCSPVSNDYFIVDETHELLTFVVRPDAHVTVLVRGGQVTSRQITVAELAQIVRGKNPKHRRLLEPKAGFWVRVTPKYPAPIASLDQQYQP